MSLFLYDQTVNLYATRIAVTTLQTVCLSHWQEQQDNLVGTAMQSVVLLLNNLVAYKDVNMKALYEQGMQSAFASFMAWYQNALHFTSSH